MNNGQVNVLMTAMMLAAGVAVMRERWNLATLALAAAFFMKLYPVALVLLFVLVYPRQLGWRCALALLVGVVYRSPCKSRAMSGRHTESWYYMLALDDRTEYALAYGYRDFYMLARWFGVPMTVRMNTFVQLAGAGIAAAICCGAGSRVGPSSISSTRPFCWAAAGSSSLAQRRNHVPTSCWRPDWAGPWSMPSPIAVELGNRFF